MQIKSISVQIVRNIKLNLRYKLSLSKSDWNINWKFSSTRQISWIRWTTDAQATGIWTVIAIITLNCILCISCWKISTFHIENCNSSYNYFKGNFRFLLLQHCPNHFRWTLNLNYNEIAITVAYRNHASLLILTDHLSSLTDLKSGNIEL